MLVVVQIDLSNANLAIFDEYESNVLPLLKRYGVRLVERLRSVDQHCEIHLLEFPNADALSEFRADPTRASLQGTWQESGAVSTLTEVVRQDYVVQSRKD